MNMKPNVEILKEPKGFIKGIELVITIFAFATVAGFIGRAEFKLNCIGVSDTRPVSVDFYYPFSEMKVYVSKNKFCINDTEIKPLTMELKYKSEAEYIVFTGVVSMLFVIVALVYYTFFEDRAKEATSTDVGYFSFPVVDFVFTVVLVIFWFTSSIAWAAALSGLKDATSATTLFDTVAPCKAQGCQSFDGARYGSATVAVVFGFLNFFVWGGNLWFLFKETPWHSPRTSGKGAESIPQEPPRQDIPSVPEI